MEGMSFSIEPGNTTSCQECKKYLETDFKFCPKCGVEITTEMRQGTFQDLLKKRVLLPSLIYEKPTGNEFHEFKLKQLLDKQATLLPYEFLTFISTKKQDYFKIDADTDAIHKKHTEKLSEYFSDSLKTYLRYTDNDRLHSKQIVLQLMKIKHTYTHMEDILTETFEDLLITLIENQISNPVCGFRLVLKSNKYIPYPSKHYKEYWNDPKNYVQHMDEVIRCTLLDKKEMPFHELRSSVKEEIVEELKSYDKIQSEVDALLTKVNVDIYYSSRNKKIYLQNELQKIFAMEIKFIGFKLEDHCEKFKIKHINVFILMPEIDDLFYFGEIREKLERASQRFKIPCEGISRKLLGLTMS